MVKRFSILAAAVVAVMAACSDSSRTPVAPTGAGGGVNPASADGSTIKLTLPVLVSPANNATTQELDTPLVIQAASGKFTSVQGIVHRFEVSTSAGAVVSSVSVNGTTFTPSGLEPNTTYQWRARGEVGSLVGSWSAPFTFRTPDVPRGYIRGNEVFDPLTEGTTVGVITGPVTFIPGVGARLETVGSRISYKLEQPLTAGEFSMLVTNMPFDTNGGKTKVMSMFNSNLDAPGSDLTTSRWRMTVEKRGDDIGDDANFRLSWKFIPGDEEDLVEAGPARRAFLPFDANKTYLFATTWGNFFRVVIREGATTGPVLYDEGDSYVGTYRPDPHWIHVGAPRPRVPDDASVPGMVVRNVWVSSNPRPAFANR